MPFLPPSPSGRRKFPLTQNLLLTPKYTQGDRMDTNEWKKITQEKKKIKSKEEIQRFLTSSYAS